MGLHGRIQQLVQNGRVGLVHGQSRVQLRHLHVVHKNLGRQSHQNTESPGIRGSRFALVGHQTCHLVRALVTALARRILLGQRAVQTCWRRGVQAQQQGHPLVVANHAAEDGQNLALFGLPLLEVAGLVVHGIKAWRCGFRNRHQALVHTLDHRQLVLVHQNLLVFVAQVASHHHVQLEEPQLAGQTVVGSLDEANHILLFGARRVLLAQTHQAVNGLFQARTQAAHLVGGKNAPVARHAAAQQGQHLGGVDSDLEGCFVHG